MHPVDGILPLLDRAGRQVDVAVGDPRQRGLADRGLRALAQRIEALVGDAERQLRLARRASARCSRPCRSGCPRPRPGRPETIWLAFSKTARTVYGVPPESTMTATAATATPTAASAAILTIRLVFRTARPGSSRDSSSARVDGEGSTGAKSIAKLARAAMHCQLVTVGRAARGRRWQSLAADPGIASVSHGPPGWWNLVRHGRLKSDCLRGMRVRVPPRVFLHGLAISSQPSSGDLRTPNYIEIADQNLAENRNFCAASVSTALKEDDRHRA